MALAACGALWYGRGDGPEDTAQTPEGSRRQNDLFIWPRVEVEVDETVDTDAARDALEAARYALAPATRAPEAPELTSRPSFGALTELSRRGSSINIEIDTDDIILKGRKTQIFMITLTMAVLETSDRTLLAASSASSVIIFACGVYLQAGGGVRGAIGAFVILAIASVAFERFLRTAQDIEAMDDFGRKYEEVRTNRLGGLEDASLGPASFSPEAPLLQPAEYADEPTTVESLIARAEQLKEQFGTQVMTPLRGRASENEAHGPNVKSAERANEKVRLEYDNDPRKLKDVLRCSVICATMAALTSSWEELELLQEQKVLEIVQVKNRFRSGAAPGGYMDVNVSVLFHGLVCEVQLHIQDFFELKATAHSCYDLCRSLGVRSAPAAPVLSRRDHTPCAISRAQLAGALKPPRTLTTDSKWHSLPIAIQAAVITLLFLTSGLAVCMACMYPICGIWYEMLPELWAKPRWFRILCCLAAMVPYSCLATITTSELIQNLGSKMLCTLLAATVCTCAVGGWATNLSWLAQILFGAYMLHFAAAFGLVRFGATHKRAQSRVALLCKFALRRASLLTLESVRFAHRRRQVPGHSRLALRAQDRSARGYDHGAANTVQASDSREGRDDGGRDSSVAGRLRPVV